MSIEWTIGAGDVDVVLADPTVSRCHAGLTERGGVLFLRDLDSTNGTVIERAGQPIPVGAETRLRRGDRISFGCCTLTLEELLSRLPEAPAAVHPSSHDAPPPATPAAKVRRLRCRRCARIIPGDVPCPHCGATDHLF